MIGIHILNSTEGVERSFSILSMPINHPFGEETWQQGNGTVGEEMQSQRML
jgi:hypothetical protein